MCWILHFPWISFWLHVKKTRQACKNGWYFIYKNFASCCCRVGNQPPDRATCPERVGALEQTIRGYADKLGDHVVERAIGLTFDSLCEAYDFYNLDPWEHGFDIRYGMPVGLFVGVHFQSTVCDTPMSSAHIVFNVSVKSHRSGMK